MILTPPGGPEPCTPSPNDRARLGIQDEDTVAGTRAPQSAAALPSCRQRRPFTKTDTRKLPLVGTVIWSTGRALS